MPDFYTLPRTTSFRTSAPATASGADLQENAAIAPRQPPFSGLVTCGTTCVKSIFFNLHKNLN
jgi:hypothetical protein